MKLDNKDERRVLRQCLCFGDVRCTRGVRMWSRHPDGVRDEWKSGRYVRVRVKVLTEYLDFS